MDSSLKAMKKITDRYTSKQQFTEYWRCVKYPFYFIYNYVYIGEIGGILKYEEAKMHPKFKMTVRSISKYHRATLMATRQLGKSTIAGCLLEWATNFFPKMPATILNANKQYSLENLEKIKFIHSNLPSFLRVPEKYKGERKTFHELENGSIVRTFYPSSTTSPSTLARSLTSPILYIDEAAHIRHMRDA